jgi:hypothetical protein
VVDWLLFGGLAGVGEGGREQCNIVHDYFLCNAESC